MFSRFLRDRGRKPPLSFPSEMDVSVRRARLCAFLDRDLDLSDRVVHPSLSPLPFFLRDGDSTRFLRRPPIVSRLLLHLSSSVHGRVI